MKKGFYLKRNVYVIVAVIIILAITAQISRSQYILRYSTNSNLVENRASLIAQASEAIELTGPAYCVAYDADDGESESIKNNVVQTLHYMKKKTISINTMEEKLNFSECSVTVITNIYIDKMGNINELANYVENGGYVMFTSTLEQDNALFQIYRKLGILSIGNLVDVEGIKLDSNVLIGEKGLTLDASVVHNTSNVVELDESSELLASSSKGIPLLWKREYGKGAFMVFNGSILMAKVNRGLIAGAISLLEPDFIYPIFNSKLIFIDDFPAPIPKGTDPAIYEDYQRDIPRFFQDIWWPDMLKIAKRAGLKYTAAVIQSYRDEVKPPFKSPIDEDRHSLISYGREVIKSGGEIGIHGYNHQSLQQSIEVANHFDYKAWSSIDDMAASIEEILSYANNTFPNYGIMSYVPPSNVLSQEGREALKQAWPSLLVISSLYDEDDTGTAYVQEFEVAKDGIVEMPRITSNYVDSSYTRWLEANTITSLGFFSHFVHPDDVLDADRNYGLSWEKLYAGFSEKLERIKEHYPWLRAMTATEAAIHQVEVLVSGVSWIRETDAIKGEITNFQADNYFVLRTKRSIAGMQHCEVTKIDEGTFLVRANGPKFEIRLGG
jgi:hypothetical protein